MLGGRAQTMTAPDWGSTRRLREYNTCHNPPGPGGGRFCSGKGGGLTRAGLTSQRPLDDVGRRTYAQVLGDMREFEGRLRAIKTVDTISVTPSGGQWAGGAELSWAVAFRGNGEARKLLAEYGKRFNQDAVLILRRPSKGEPADFAFEVGFDGRVPPRVRMEIGKHLSNVGFGGWTWYRRQGQTTLRVVTVPQWDGDPAKGAQALPRILARFSRMGLRFSTRKLNVVAEVMERTTDRKRLVPGYDDVLAGKTLMTRHERTMLAQLAARSRERDKLKYATDTIKQAQMFGQPLKPEMLRTLRSFGLRV